MRKNKKAQVTIFLIIGVILLFSSAILLYIRGQSDAVAGDFSPTIEEVPFEMQPAKIFVENCVKKVTKDALRMVGFQGGYINLSDPVLSGRSFEDGTEPTESDYLEPFPTVDVKVPYWHHMNSPNDCSGNCKFAMQIPPLEKTSGQGSIEAQVDAYVKEKLPECLADFSALKAQGFDVTEMGDISPDFRTGLTDVAIFVDYPIKVSKDGKESEVREFFVRFDLNLRQIYELAKQITNAQKENQLLEWHTLNLISMASHPMGEDRLPPIAEIALDYSDYYIWTRTQTQDRLEKYVLPQGIAMLSVLPSRNHLHKNIFDENGEPDFVSMGLLENMVLTLNTTETYSDVSARFLYNGWPSYLNINDREILKPFSLLNEYVPLFNPKTYYFKYDLSYPILVMLEDSEAIKEDNKGYQFIFALEINIRKNRPLNNSFSAPETGINYAPMMCDEKHWNSGNITVEVKDIVTGQPIEGARIDSSYGDFFCYMGQTEIVGDKALMISKFPVGFGEIRVMKEGYAPYSQSFGAELEKDGELVVELIREDFMKARVSMRPLTYLPGTGGSYVMLNPEEDALPVMNGYLAVLSLTRIDDDPYKGYETAIIYDRAKGIETEFRVIPGNYEVRGHLIKTDRPVVIEATDYTVEVPFGDDKTIHMNRTEINQWPEGGIVLENGYYLNIPPEAIMDNKTAIFRVLRFPEPEVHSREFGDRPDLTQISEHQTYSEKYAEYLQPIFVE